MNDKTISAAIAFAWVTGWIAHASGQVGQDYARTYSNFLPLGLFLFCFTNMAIGFLLGRAYGG